MDNKVMKVEISQEDCDILEGLQVELEGQKSLLGYLTSKDNTYEIDQKVLDTQFDKHSKLFATHHYTMNEIARKYVPEEISKLEYNFSIVFATRTVIYTIAV